MKIPLQSRKRGSINERLHLFAKDEKGYPFYQWALVTTRRKRVPLFCQFCCHSKRLGKGVKFQDIYNTDKGNLYKKKLLMALIIAILFS